MSMNRVKNLVLGMAVAANVWAIASWIDVVAVNCKPEAVEAAWNMFKLLF